MGTYRGAEQGNLRRRVNVERQMSDTLRFVNVPEIVREIPEKIIAKFKMMKRTRQ